MGLPSSFYVNDLFADVRPGRDLNINLLDNCFLLIHGL